MKTCKNCGGSCKDLGGGNYKCNFCGAAFSAEDFEVAAAVSSRTQASVNNQNGVDIFESTVGGVLEISWKSNRGVFSGSGLLITRDGYGITNAHVVLNGSEAVGSVNVNIAGQRVTARVIGVGSVAGSGEYYRGDDLALLKLASVPEKATVLEFEDFSNVRTGEPVFVIGNSLGHGTCITRGIVSDRRRTVEGRPRIMTDCATNGGNSGGPVFNERGKVIGVHVAAAMLSENEHADGMKYEIPSDIVIDFIRKYLPYFG
ncbi:MAG: trypsin-like serine protease [Clostridia bacterium]|nr:trypsin-like serine protease [Clostridia bacterium]